MKREYGLQKSIQFPHQYNRQQKSVPSDRQQKSFPSDRQQKPVPSENQLVPVYPNLEHLTPKPDKIRMKTSLIASPELCGPLSSSFSSAPESDSDIQFQVISTTQYRPSQF